MIRCRYGHTSYFSGCEDCPYCDFPKQHSECDVIIEDVDRQLVKELSRLRREDGKQAAEVLVAKHRLSALADHPPAAPQCDCRHRFDPDQFDHEATCSYVAVPPAAPAMVEGEAKLREALERCWLQRDIRDVWNIVRAALADHSPAAPAMVEGEAWRSMDTAPKNNTMVELLIDYTDGEHPLQDAIRACTIGFNSFDDCGEDRWKFAGWCWSHDHFTEGRGTPIAWRPSRLNASDSGLSALTTPQPATDPVPEIRGDSGEAD